MNDKPAWQSKTLIGAWLTIIASFAGMAGYAMDVEMLTDLALFVVTAGSGVLSWYGRVKAEKPIRPLPRLSRTPKV